MTSCLILGSHVSAMMDCTLELGAKTDFSFQKLLVGSFVAAVRKANTTSLPVHSGRTQTSEGEEVCVCLLFKVGNVL